jgi:D-alanyl-D-alanine carboxypeptidase
MAWGISGARQGLRYCLLGLAPVVTAVAHAEGYSPPSASIVVDGNSGAVLQASHPDALRHPASLTKIMTLYLLFERLEVGKIKLDSPLKVSEHASGQAPTKLGLKPGETIAVEDAIKAIITKSANDAAVVVAENLGGDESNFAKLMTQKARALGMTHTTYINSSGLPDDDQITTARDQALLGRLIQKQFPRYYKYFSIETFVYRGEAMRNHNHLLGSIEGVDGIKTGFTRASGFNVVTSVHRNGYYIVAVVMGGRSSLERDAHIRELISSHIKDVALKRSAPAVAKSNQPNEIQLASANAPIASQGNHTDPIQPRSVKTITVRTTPMQSASLTPMTVLVPVAATAPEPSAQVAARWLPLAPPADQPHTIVTSAEPKPVAQTPAQAAPAFPEPAKLEPQKIEAAKLAGVRVEFAKVETVSAPVKSHIAAPYTPARAQNGWLIQIGAFDREDEARQRLSTARLKVRDALATGHPLTERVQKGDKVLYRARFTGFDKETADVACRQLKRGDISCIALKN